MKKIALVIILTLLAPTEVNAATKKPTPKPTVTATAKASAKATIKVTGTAKATVKKRIYKRYVRKRVKVTPSPSPKWPPANFTNSGSIYAKIPSAQELDSYASNSSDLTMGLSYCEKFACGSVFLASETGCNWWQVDSMVTAPNQSGNGRDTLGSIRTLANGSREKKIIAVLLKSNVPLADGVSVGGITARCWATPKPDNLPSNTFTANPNLPLATPSPTH